MESVLSRYRNLIILVGVLFLQVLGLAMQVKRANNEAQDTRLIRIWAVGAISPFERSVVWLQNGTSNLWHNYIYLRGVRAENRELKEQIEQMRLEQVRLNQDATQAHRLQTLLAFKEQYVAKTVAAQVIGSSGSDLSRVIYIDKGENDGLGRDMAVITADGIVGKVLTVYPSVSQVLLINDPSSGVGAILEKSRLQGVLRGSANGEVMLERVMSDEQVTPGETLLTSGGDQIFPKGLPIGTVMAVGNGRDLFLNIRIKPAADLSKLEEVLVLVEKQERQVTAEDKTRVRAADILAQRLPSVPDKPAADAKPGSTSGTATSPKTATANPALKPKNSPPASGPQTAKIPGTAVQTVPASKKPVAATANTAAKQSAANGIMPAKPVSQDPSITEQNKPAAPAAPPIIQPASKPDDSPH